jgi:hypothetical protein
LWISWWHSSLVSMIDACSMDLSTRFFHAQFTNLSYKKSSKWSFLSLWALVKFFMSLSRSAHNMKYNVVREKIPNILETTCVRSISFRSWGNRFMSIEQSICKKKTLQVEHYKQEKKMVIHHPLDVCHDSIVNEPQQS